MADLWLSSPAWAEFQLHSVFHQNQMPPSCFMAKPSKNLALTVKWH